MSTFKLKHGDLVVKSNDWVSSLIVIEDDYLLCDELLVVDYGREMIRYTGITLEAWGRQLTEDALLEVAIEWKADTIERVNHQAYRLVRNKS